MIRQGMDVQKRNGKLPYAINTAIWMLISTLLPIAAMAVPYPESSAITNLTFDWSTHDRRAPGSDNWPITWADDGNQYTVWGDGGGFGGTNSDGRVSLGFARVEGDPHDYQGINIWGGKNGEHTAQFDGKSYGILSLHSTLYAWWGPGSNTRSYDETRLLRSTDRGATWTKSTWDLTHTDPSLIMPTMLNFGQDYDGARDEYVYHYFVRKDGNPATLGVHQSGKIDLARVPTSNMIDRQSFEWFAGLDGSNEPVWTSQATGRQAVFEDPNGVGWNVSISHNAGLDRYMLATEHTESFKGNFGLFDAPEPWGPWSTVAYLNHDSGDQFGAAEIQDTTFYWNFSNKWLSDDGQDFVLVFTGVGQNDSWNTVQGRFSTGPPPADGDVNGDGFVDDDDFEIIRANFFDTVLTRGEGDLNRDGLVDFLDFRLWKANVTGAAGSSHVPEPSSGELLLILAAVATPNRRRRVNVEVYHCGFAMGT